MPPRPRLLPALLLTTALLLSTTACSKRSTEGLDRAVSGSVYGDVVPVEVAVLDPKPFVEEFDIAGQVEAKELVTVAAETNGRVSSVRREIGDQVRRGQVLVGLDARSAQANVQKIEAQLSRAKTDLAWAQKELARQTKLYSDLVTAERALDDSQREVDTQRVEVETQQAELALAKIELDRVTVTAPISGAVATRHTSVGEYVLPGTPLMDIVSKRMVFVLSVAERDVVALEPGVELAINVDALSEPVPGKVLAVSPSGNQQTRTFRVEVALEDSAADAGVKPGMSGRTRIARRSYDSALLIPEASVLRDGTTSYVYVLDRTKVAAVDDSGERSGDDLATVVRRPITVLSQVGSNIVAAPDFPAGTEFVVVGQSAVSEGSKVRVRLRHEAIIEQKFQ